MHLLFRGVFAVLRRRCHRYIRRFSQTNLLCIEVPHGSSSLLDLSMDRAKKLELYRRGMEAAERFVARHG